MAEKFCVPSSMRPHVHNKVRRVAAPDGLKSEKIRPTLKSLKYLATKLTPVVTPIPVIHPSASQLWIDLNLCLEHINATSETIVAGVAACRHARGSYTKHEQHSSAAQSFHMGPSVGTGADPPAMTNTAVDHMACDTEVWCEPSRAPLYRLSAGAQRVSMHSLFFD